MAQHGDQTKDRRARSRKQQPPSRPSSSFGERNRRAEKKQIQEALSEEFADKIAEVGGRRAAHSGNRFASVCRSAAIGQRQMPVQTRPAEQSGSHASSAQDRCDKSGL